MNPNSIKSTDVHNKSTNNLLHHIILNNSILSDKYRSLTIINNTINYNNNINNYNNYLFKENKEKNNISAPSQHTNKISKNNSKDNNKDNHDDDNYSISINNSGSSGKKRKAIENLKNNLGNTNSFKELENFHKVKSVSSREREEKNNINNNINDIINSENNIIVNIEECSSSQMNNENDRQSLTNDYNLKNQNKTNDKQILNIDITTNDVYAISFDSPNKDANLVKNGKFRNNISTSISKSKGEEDIIKLYNLNDTINNDIIFIFVNEGTNEGLKLLNLGLKYFTQNINKRQISIYIFDMNNETENNKMNEGIELLLVELKLHKMIKLVLCCGDSDIYPFISKLNDININFEKLIFCVLPFGRTNDLSTHFGFGKSFYSKFNLTTLKKIIQDVIESITMNIDIWEMKITCDEKNGGYIAINNNLEKCKTETSTIRKGFISYFSLGYDSKIGFDISKKKSVCWKCCNCLNFWWEGIKKSYFTKSIKLNQYLEALYHINLHKNDSVYDDGNEMNQTLKEDNGRKITIFRTCGFNEQDNISENNSKSDHRIASINEDINNKNYNKSNAIPADEVDGDEEFNKKSDNIDIDNNIENEESESESEYETVNSALKTFKKEKIIIKGEPLGLICQNIKYFCDGNISKWDNKKPSYGIQTYSDNKILTDSTNKYFKELKKVRIFNVIFILL